MAPGQSIPEPSIECPSVDTQRAEKYAVAVVPKGGTAIAGERGVAVAGVDAVKAEPSSWAYSGDYGASIGPFDGASCVRTGQRGIAAGGKNSKAYGGDGAIAAIHDGGSATAGNSGTAVSRGVIGKCVVANSGTAICSGSGEASAADEGTALIQSGLATAERYGLASVRCSGSAIVGQGGIAVAWNHMFPLALLAGGAGIVSGIARDDETDADLGSVRAGTGGIVVAFMEDVEKGTRVPVIGFVGTSSGRVHYDLRPDTSYRLDQKTGEFVPLESQGQRKPARRSTKSSKKRVYRRK